MSGFQDNFLTMNFKSIIWDSKLNKDHCFVDWIALPLIELVAIESSTKKEQGLSKENVLV